MKIELIEAIEAALQERYNEGYNAGRNDMKGALLSGTLMPDKETIKMPQRLLLTFDEWFKTRSGGMSFDQCHMRHPSRYENGLHALMTAVRDYVSEMVR